MFKAYVQRIRARLHGIMHQGRGEGGSMGGTGSTPRRRLHAPTDSLCAITDVGRRRQHNEDTFHISDTGTMLVVADGMGGHAAGEVASTLAVEALVEFFTDACPKAGEADARPIEALLREAFATAHRQVRAASRQRVEYHGMGTTLIMASVQGNRLYTCHVGDVRCYLRTATSLEQITQDHSVVGALVRAGALSSAQARGHPMKHQLLQAIGLPDDIVPEVHTRVLANGDCLLLCSDGLWGALSDEDIHTGINQGGSMCQRATHLVDRANDAGGYDNITVVLYAHVARGAYDEVREKRS